MMEDPPPRCNVKRCLVILLLGNLLTPLDTQAPTPVLPVLLTEDLGLPVVSVGRLFAIMTFGALISFAMLMVMAKKMTPRHILLIDFSIRFLSGCLYLAALTTPGGHAWTIPLLYTSRFLYGLSLNSFALPTSWIGVRMPVKERQGAVVATGALLGLGIAFGPVLGAALVSIMPTTWVGYQTMGYFTLLESAFLWILVFTRFDDDEVMPTAKQEEVTNTSEAIEEASKVKFIIRASIWASFFLTMGQVAGFEALFGLAILHSYGWREASALPPWITFGVVITSAFVLFKPLNDKFNQAKLAFGCSAGCALVLALVNFFNFSEPVPRWQVFLGLLGNGPALFLITLFQTTVSTRVPRDQQVSANSTLQFMGQLGRGIGPVVSTAWYQFFTHQFGRSGGMNAAGLNFAFFLIIGLSFAFSRFTTFFGKFDAPSAQEEREGASKQMM